MASCVTFLKSIIIINIQFYSKELLLVHGTWVRVHCDLDRRDMTLGKGHGIPLGYGQ